MPSGLQSGRALELTDLVSIEAASAAPPAPDRTFDLMVSWGMMMAPDEWSIDGERHPDADPLDAIRQMRVDLNPLLGEES